MKIEQLYLSNYKRLKHSNIDNLTWEINKSIQIILGSNGSGKTSLIKQVIPSVPIKSEFKKNGKRKLIISHKGSIYSLISDFSASTKAHSFLKNDEELNPGHGADIQKELIEKHLGVSSVLVKCLSVEIDWANLTPSSRKTFVHHLNPINMDLLLDSHKSIRKSITRLNNNISLLKDRETIISSKLMESKELEKLKNEYNKLDETHNSLIKFLTYLQTIKESITYENKNLSIDEKSIRNTINKMNHILFEHKLVLEDEDRLQSLMDITITKINSIEDDIKSLSQEIEKYKVYKKHLSEKEKENYIRNLLEKNYKSMEKIKKILLDEYRFSLENIHDKEFRHKVELFNCKSNEICDKLLIYGNTIINSLNEIKIKRIYSSSILDKIKSKVLYLESSLSQIQQRISETENEIRNIQSSLKKLETKDIPLKCIDTNLNQSCALFLSYQNSLNSFLNSIKTKENQLNELNKKKKTYSIGKRKLSTFYQFQISAKNAYIEFMNLMNRYDFLYSVILNTNFTTLKNLSFYLSKAVNISTLLINYFKLFDENEKYRERAKQIKANDSYSSEFIDTIIKEKENSLENINTIYRSLNKEYLKIKHDLEILSKMKSLNHTLQKCKENIEDYISYTIKDTSKKFYQEIIKIVNEYINEIYTRKERIESIIKEQDYLIDRLENEINTLLKKLENDFNLGKKIEIIVKELIMDSIIEFIKEWIEITNVFLEKICTYEFSIVLENLSPENDFSWKFPIKVGDLLITDISNCSSGQKDMLKLAMNMAILVVLNFHEYPIYIDEIDRTLDEKHKIRLLEFLKYLLDNKIVSQIFLSNHHAMFYEAIIGDVVVLNNENITVPSKYNENLKINE